MALIACYCDDSSDERQQATITAGAVFQWSSNFLDAEGDWRKELKAARIDYFKASECEQLLEQFDTVKHGMSLSSGRAYAESVRYKRVSALERYKIDMLAVSMVIPDFNEVLATHPRARAEYGGEPANLVYRRLIRTLIEETDERFPSHPIAFTFDSHSNYLAAEGEYDKLRNNDPVCARRMGWVGHDDDKQLVHLQMADLWASEARLKTIAWL